MVRASESDGGYEWEDFWLLWHVASTAGTTDGQQCHRIEVRSMTFFGRQARGDVYALSILSTCRYMSIFFPSIFRHTSVVFRY